MDQRETVEIQCTLLATLILGVRDRMFFDGDDECFANVAKALALYETAHPNTSYHLEWNPDLPYTRGDDMNVRSKGRWILWHRTDWELSQELYKKQKAASDERVKNHDNREMLRAQLMRSIAASFSCNIEDDIVNNIVSAIMHTKNRMMAEHYKVDKDLITLVWG